MASTKVCPGSGYVILSLMYPVMDAECPRCDGVWTIDITDDVWWIPTHRRILPNPSPPQSECMPSAE